MIASRPAPSARKQRKQRKLRQLVLAGVVMLGLPSAGLALAAESMTARESLDDLGLGMFTPASVDPALAARVADKSRARGIRFTPARAASITGERTVTVAVRVDDDKAMAILVRKPADAAPGRGIGLGGLDIGRFELGSARGYKSFARTFTRPVDLSANVRSMALPDLAQFEPAQPETRDKVSRLQPQITLDDREIAGRSPNTLDSIGAQTVDVGGSFRLSPNFNVTAGVRYSHERERIDPLTNSVQDSQAVYVGTQIKF